MIFQSSKAQGPTVSIGDSNPAGWEVTGQDAEGKFKISWTSSNPDKFFE